MEKFFVIKLVGNESYLSGIGTFLPYDDYNTLEFFSIDEAESHIKNSYIQFNGVKPALTIVEIYK